MGRHNHNGLGLSYLGSEFSQIVVSFDGLIIQAMEHEKSFGQKKKKNQLTRSRTLSMTIVGAPCEMKSGAKTFCMFIVECGANAVPNNVAARKETNAARRNSMREKCILPESRRDSHKITN